MSLQWHRDLEYSFQAGCCDERRMPDVLLPIELDSLLSRSFPAPEHVPAIRAAYASSLADDGLGLETKLVDGTIHGAYTVAILTAVVAT